MSTHVLKNRRRKPKPIRISPHARNLILLALAAVLLLIVWLVPFALIISLLGFALALVLSFPVRWLSHVMSRGLAILLSFLIVLVMFVLTLLFLVPLIVDQVTALVQNLPELVWNLERYLIAALKPLQERGFLTQTPQEIVAELDKSLRGSLDVIARNVLGGALGFLYGTFNFVFTLFGMAFVGISLLIGVRGFEASYLKMVPHAYRPDARQLWEELSQSLSRYVGGLGLILLIQGAISALALYLIGVPYALALGAWVSVTAVIPYLGAWLGAIPAMIVAFSVSWTAVLLTALAFLAIQLLEGNVLTPKIQGDTLDVPAVIVFLAVIVGGGLGGFLGVIFAVPTVAVLKVLFDFFYGRLTTAGQVTT